MYRAGNGSRTSDEFFINVSPPLKGSPAPRTADMDQLPNYDPASDLAKKEASNPKSAEKSIHLIPVVLIICVLILWFSSHHDVAVMKQSDSVVARDRRASSTIEAYNNLTWFTSTKEPENLIKQEQSDDGEGERTLQKVEPER